MSITTFVALLQVEYSDALHWALEDCLSHFDVSDDDDRGIYYFVPLIEAQQLVEELLSVSCRHIFCCSHCLPLHSHADGGCLDFMIVQIGSAPVPISQVEAAIHALHRSEVLLKKMHGCLHLCEAFKLAVTRRPAGDQEPYSRGARECTRCKSAL